MAQPCSSHDSASHGAGSGRADVQRLLNELAAWGEEFSQIDEAHDPITPERHRKSDTEMRSLLQTNLSWDDPSSSGVLIAGALAKTCTPYLREDLRDTVYNMVVQGRLSTFNELLSVLAQDESASFTPIRRLRASREFCLTRA